MSNTTDTYWDVDGVSLQTYATNISTLGPADNVPAWRGADRAYPYRAGAQARPQVAESRTLPLAMWTIAADEEGVPAAALDEKYRQNRQAIKRLMWKPRGELFALTKRWKEGGVVKSATAMGRLASDMAAEKGGPHAAKFVAEIFLPDPWFYGPEVTTSIPVGVPTIINNIGDDLCTAITIDYIGQLTNPLLTNSTPEPDVWMKLGSSIAIGSTVRVDVELATVKRLDDSANLIGTLTHSGSREWMGLRRGNNSLLLTVDGGTGHADFKHRPTYW